MAKKITAFIPACNNSKDIEQSLHEFKSCGLDMNICLLAGADTPLSGSPDSQELISVSSLFSSEALKKIACHAQSEFILLYIKSLPPKLGQFAVQRMLQVAVSTFAGMVYSDYYVLKEGKTLPNPVIEYQDGSIRDDFNFGSLLLFKTASFKEAVSGMKENYQFAGLYDLRLKLSQKSTIFHIPEFLYTEAEPDTRKSGEKQFDYVNPKNRDVQIEMEKVCTGHLKETGAWLAPKFRDVKYDNIDFDNEVSVIIPVKNRNRTIAEAIESVLAQKAPFKFNIIIVDNHSTDGTSEIIEKYKKNDSRVVHIIPERSDLGIGGCWNEAVFHPSCGKFSVQLDSDDLYIDEHVLSQIVEAFYTQNCAMVVGTYRMVNFKLEEIPPGIIGHREWTPENGRNNALRINGLGAPRAFYTPVIRSVRAPNVSYGEDYALGLAISRYYQIGRIYNPLYLCRRWEENSDASLDVQKLNTYNFYKDTLRTMELKARQRYIKEGQEV